MTLRNTLLRLRYLALVLPAFAFFSAVEAGCSSETSTSKKDDLAHEDPSPNGGGAYGTYNNTYDDDTYDTYGYE